MKIEVTQEHIDKGKRAKCRACPVALAIRDATAHRLYRHVDVGTTEVEVGKVVVSLPRKASTFIFRFDTGRPVKPFAFELEI